MAAFDEAPFDDGQDPDDENSAAGEALRTRRDDAAERVRMELRRMVRDSGLTQRRIESLNGFSKGYLSQVLQGNIVLTVRHFFGIVMALERRPAKVIARLLADPGHDPDSQFDEIRQRMSRYDAAIEELTERGILSLEPEGAPASESSDHETSRRRTRSR